MNGGKSIASNVSNASTVSHPGPDRSTGIASPEKPVKISVLLPNSWFSSR
jgi:hypothetical protein